MMDRYQARLTYRNLPMESLYLPSRMRVVLRRIAVLAVICLLVVYAVFRTIEVEHLKAEVAAMAATAASGEGPR